jgi:hypothetical protein
MTLALMNVEQVKGDNYINSNNITSIQGTTMKDLLYFLLCRAVFKWHEMVK